MEDIYHPVTKKALQEYRKHLGEIVQKAVEKVLAVEQSQEHADRILAGIEFTLKMLDGAASIGEIALLEDQLNWALSYLPGQGTYPDQLLTRFQLISVILEEQLSEGTWMEFKPYLDWIITRQRELVENAGTLTKD